MNLDSVVEHHPSVCPLDCPDTCSLTTVVRDNRVVEVRGSKANPYTSGVICSKVVNSYPEMIHGPRRLTQPLKRIGARESGQFVPISWDEAIDMVFEGFSSAINRYGPESVMPFNYAGPHGQLAGGSMDRRFFYKLGATLLNRGPLCGAVRATAYTSLYGAVAGMPPEQAEHADLIVIWGNNVTISNLHFARVLKSAREKGAKVVTIDPKRVRVAEQSHLHLQIQPGTDVILAMAVAAELERRDKLDEEFIDKWTVGIESYMEEARKYTPSDVERKCGISVEQFNAFVNLYIKASVVAVSIGNGIERGRCGGSGLRAAMALQALTGNHGRLGAGVFCKPGFAAPMTPDRLQRPDLIPTGTRTFNIVDVAEILLDEYLAPPVMATMIYNHNPVATHPNQGRLITALKRENLFIAGCDIVMTDSMKFADVILPAASHFESDDIYGAYGQNYVQRAKPVISPVGSALPNTEIFRRLAARFGFDDPMFQDSDEDLMDLALDGDSELLKGFQPSQIPLDQALVVKAPDNEDIVLCKNLNPATPSGKIELYSDDLQNRFGVGVPRYREMQQDKPFVLISPSSSKRTNATFGGCQESEKVELLEMNPSDAAERSLNNGDLIRVWNERGQVNLKLSVTDATRPGVLYSAKGTWLDSTDTGMTVNALIPSDMRADIEHGACYNETYVDVS